MGKTISPVLLIFLFFLSGFCNLVYEITWARLFDLVFGVTVFAISAVLASFMLGLAAGGLIFGRIAEKVRNRIALFSWLHLGIFLSSVSLLLFFPVFQDVYLAISRVFNPDFYLFRIILLFLSLVFMIIPTTLMGATFPVASKILITNSEKTGIIIGNLYSANTLGSVLGCAVTIFFLLGPMGTRGTVFIAAGADLLIGLTVLLFAHSYIPGREAS
jgi:spermidine synthase